jgi:hypothetical protein
MTDTPKAKPRFRVTWTKFWICLFLLFVLGWAGAELRARHALNAAIREIRSDGEPLTWEEVFASLAPIPDEENSALALAPHMEDVLAWGQSPSAEVMYGSITATFGVRPSDLMLGFIRGSIAENRAVLAALHESAQLPGGRWPFEPTPWGWGLDGPPYQGLRSAGRVLKRESILAASEGDSRRAALAVFAARRLAASLNGNPESGAWVRAHAANVALGAAESALSLCEFSVEDLAMLRKEFAAEEQQMTMRTLILVERARYLWMATNARTQLWQERGGMKGMEVVREYTPGAVEAQMIAALAYCGEWMALLDLPPREQRSAVRRLRHKVYPLARAWEDIVLRSDYGNFFYGTRGHLVARQRLHIARAALAVEQFRVERGDWPEKLADLVPAYLDAVPQDWFAPTDTTIAYTQSATGVRLWSRIDGTAVCLAKDERENLTKLRQNIWYAAHTPDSGAPQLPKSLEALVPDWYDALPIDTRTGKPYSYVWNAATPDLFVLGGIPYRMTKNQGFELQDTGVGKFSSAASYYHTYLVFRLLNPELRGAKQARLCDEIDASCCARGLYKLGYTSERLQELGFSDEQVESYRKDLKWIEECEREEEAEKRERENQQQSEPPDVLPDTPAEATP